MFNNTPILYQFKPNDAKQALFQRENIEGRAKLCQSAIVLLINTDTAHCDLCHLYKIGKDMRFVVWFSVYHSIVNTVKLFPL